MTISDGSRAWILAAAAVISCQFSDVSHSGSGAWQHVGGIVKLQLSDGSGGHGAAGSLVGLLSASETSIPLSSGAVLLTSKPRS